MNKSMREPIAVVVPKDLYYHEVDYVRGLEARVARLEAALSGLEPYLDSIVCYASMMGEHEPDRLVYDARRALAGD